MEFKWSIGAKTHRRLGHHFSFTQWNLLLPSLLLFEYSFDFSDFQNWRTSACPYVRQRPAAGALVTSSFQATKPDFWRLINKIRPHWLLIENWCILYRVDEKYATAAKSKIFLRAFRFSPKDFFHYSWKGVANNMYVEKIVSK